MAKYSLIVFSSYQLACFIYSKMLSQKFVEMMINQFGVSDFGVLRKILMMSHIFDIFSAFQQPSSSLQFFCFCINFMTLMLVIQELLQASLAQSVFQNCCRYGKIIIPQITIWYSKEIDCQQRLQKVQYLDIFGLEICFCFCILLAVLRQSINSYICFFLLIINSKMIPRQLLSLTNLSSTRIYEAMQIVVVCRNEHIMFAIFGIMLPCIKSFNNNQEFIVVSFLLSFY